MVIDKARNDAAYANYEINLGINHETYVFFSCRWWTTHSKIDNLSICPPNIFLDLFPFLLIPYSC